MIESNSENESDEFYEKKVVEYIRSLSVNSNENSSFKDKGNDSPKYIYPSEDSSTDSDDAINSFIKSEISPSKNGHETFIKPNFTVKRSLSTSECKTQVKGTIDMNQNALCSTNDTIKLEEKEEEEGEEGDLVNDEVDSDSSIDSVGSSPWKFIPTTANVVNNKKSNILPSTIKTGGSSSDCSDDTYESRILNYLSGISLEENANVQQKSCLEMKEVDYYASSSWESDDSFTPSFRYKRKTEAKQKIWETLEKSMEEENLVRRTKKFKKKKEKKKSITLFEKSEAFLEAGRNRNRIMEQIQLAHLIQNQSTRVESKGQPIQNQSLRIESKEPVNSGPHWLCELCEVTFETCLMLNAHMAVKHESFVKFVCRNCGQQFQESNRYNEHFRLAHQDKLSSVFCYICREELSNFDGLIKHLKDDHVTKEMYPVRCEHCSISLLNDEVFEKHFDSVSKQCNTNLVSVKKVQNDVATKFKVQRGNETYIGGKDILDRSTYSFPCDLCKSVFKTRKYLRYHRAVKHDLSKTLACNICEKKFAVAYKLKEHFKCVHNSDLFICKICNKQFTNNYTLNTHEKREHLKQYDEFVCIYCDKHFHRKPLMVEHVARMNTLCPWCSSILDCRTKLLEHIDSKHRLCDRLECIECKRNVYSFTKFWNHLILFHPELYRLVNTNSVVCDKCSQLCGSMHHLRKHQRKVCLVAEKNVCKFCGIRFNTNYLESVHLKPTMLCRMCGLTFKCLTFLKEHIHYDHSSNRNLEEIDRTVGNLKMDNSSSKKSVSLSTWEGEESRALPVSTLEGEESRVKTLRETDSDVESSKNSQFSSGKLTSTSNLKVIKIHDKTLMKVDTSVENSRRINCTSRKMSSSSVFSMKDPRICGNTFSERDRHVGNSPKSCSTKLLSSSTSSLDDHKICDSSVNCERIGNSEKSCFSGVATFSSLLDDGKACEKGLDIKSIAYNTRAINNYKSNQVKNIEEADSSVDKFNHSSNKFPYNCFTCNSNFLREQDLECHERLAHTSDNNSEDDVITASFMVCDHCGGQFRRRSLLTKHFQNCVCTICEAVFKCWTLLSEHCHFVHRNNDVTSVWPCNECAATFKSSLWLVKHTVRCHRTISLNVSKFHKVSARKDLNKEDVKLEKHNETLIKSENSVTSSSKFCNSPSTKRRSGHSGVGRSKPKSTHRLRKTTSSFGGIVLRPKRKREFSSSDEEIFIEKSDEFFSQSFSFDRVECAEKCVDYNGGKSLDNLQGRCFTGERMKSNDVVNCLENSRGRCFGADRKDVEENCLENSQGRCFGADRKDMEENCLENSQGRCFAADRKDVEENCLENSQGRCFGAESRADREDVEENCLENSRGHCVGAGKLADISDFKENYLENSRGHCFGAGKLADISDFEENCLENSQERCVGAGKRAACKDVEKRGLENFQKPSGSLIGNPRDSVVESLENPLFIEQKVKCLKNFGTPRKSSSNTTNRCESVEKKLTKDLKINSFSTPPHSKSLVDNNCFKKRKNCCDIHEVVSPCFKNIEICHPKKCSVNSLNSLDCSQDLVIDTSISVCQNDESALLDNRNLKDETALRDDPQAVCKLDEECSIRINEMERDDFFLNLELVSSTPVDRFRKCVDNEKGKLLGDESARGSLKMNPPIISKNLFAKNYFNDKSENRCVNSLIGRHNDVSEKNFNSKIESSFVKNSNDSCQNDSIENYNDKWEGTPEKTSNGKRKPKSAQDSSRVSIRNYSKNESTNNSTRNSYKSTDSKISSVRQQLFSCESKFEIKTLPSNITDEFNSNKTSCDELSVEENVFKASMIPKDVSTVENVNISSINLRSQENSSSKHFSGVRFGISPHKLKQTTQKSLPIEKNICNETPTVNICNTSIFSGVSSVKINPASILKQKSNVKTSFKACRRFVHFECGPERITSKSRNGGSLVDKSDSSSSSVEITSSQAENRAKLTSCDNKSLTKAFDIQPATLVMQIHRCRLCRKKFTNRALLQSHLKANSCSPKIRTLS